MFRDSRASVYSNLGEEISKSWKQNLLLKPGHQGCRIYKPQTQVTETRHEEETKKITGTVPIWEIVAKNTENVD